MIYTTWVFREDSFLPILKVHGKCHVKDTEDILLRKAVRIIDCAKLYGAIPLPRPFYECKLQEGDRVRVEFSLIFPSRDSLIEFAEVERNSQLDDPNL